LYLDSLTENPDVQTNLTCGPSCCPTLVVIVLDQIWMQIAGVLADWSRYGEFRIWLIVIV
jgi:hypothetical protein